ncbi:MAG: hypothetical protein [Podoviridae sp. ctLUJ1]|nr:MAG: hypothetical protein [Podoviridae sp. ctLUJ1]
MAVSTNIEELTKGTVDGTGAFDCLMRAVTAHLEKEHKATRITGADYTQVYLGSITAVLAQATQYVLQSEITKKQTALIDSQIKNIEKNSELVAAQIRKIDADVAVSEQQVRLMQEQTAQVIQQTRLTTQQVTNAMKDAEVATEQILKIKAEVKAIEQNIINAKSQDLLINKNLAKIDIENELLEQKIATEKAQTIGNSTTVQGVLGKQMLLFDKQAEGFDRNAEQKLAKILVDTWTVRQTTDGANVDTNGLSDSEINKVLNIAKEGIGAAPFS